MGLAMHMSLSALHRKCSGAGCFQLQTFLDFEIFAYMNLEDGAKLQVQNAVVLYYFMYIIRSLFYSFLNASAFLAMA